MTSQPAPAPDPETADLLAQAERRRVKLVALSDMAMVRSQEICNRWVEGPYHPEPRHDAGRSFAAVTRSARLSVVLEARVDAEILALRKGVMPAVKPWGSSAAGGLAVTSASRPAAPGRADGEGGRYRTAEGWREAFDLEADGLDGEDGALRGDRERLSEGEAEDELADGDFDVCVDVIRAGMGLSALPDGEREAEPDDRNLVDDKIRREPAPLALVPEPPPRTPKDLVLVNSARPPCAPSVTARERAPRHLPRKRAGEEYG